MSALVESDTEPRGLAQEPLLVAARLAFACYAIWLALGFLGANAGIGLMAAVLSALVLEAAILDSVRYDVRSAATILLVFCQLYFAARFSFASRGYDWWLEYAYLCYCLFLAGVLIQTRRRSDDGFARLFAGDVPVSRKGYINAVTFGFLAAYLAIYFYLLQETGATGSFLALVLKSLITRLKIVELGLSPLLQLALLMSSLGLLSALIGVRLHRSRFPILIWILAIVTTGLTLGSRGGIVIPLAQLLLAASLLSRRPLRVAAIVGAPMLLAVTWFSTWYLSIRDGGSGEIEGYSILDRFDAYSNWLDSLREAPPAFAFGASLPSALAQFIPRAFFPGKPYYYSTAMTERFFPDAFRQGVTFDFGGIAESLYNFGIVGPLALGLWVGFVARQLETLKFHAAKNRSPLQAFLYAQAAILPSVFFFIGWINSAALLATVVFLIFSVIARSLFGKSVT